MDKFFSCEIGKYYSIMPRKSKISQFDVHVIADGISEIVLALVHFDTKRL